MPTKYYAYNVNVQTTCDDLSPQDGDHDMIDTAPGSATSHNSNVSGLTSYTLLRCYKDDVSGDTPLTGSQTYNISVDVTVLTKCDIRFRIAAVDTTGCARTYSGYQEYLVATGTGIKTFSLTLNFGAGDEHLELQMEGRQESGAHGTREVTISVDDNDTWVEAPWPVAGTTSKPRAILHG